MQELNFSKIKEVLLIAPHPDDDVIGAAGFIYKALVNNIKLKIFYITDGTGSKNPDNLDLKELRKNEAKLSIDTLTSNILNVSNNLRLSFLEFKSSEIKKNKELLNFVLNEETKNTTILLPHYTDIHETHSFISNYFINKSKFKKILFYEVWGTVRQNKKILYIDISDIQELKKQSILKHNSQCIIKPFADGILAKNRYNAIFKDINLESSATHVEFFEVYDD